MESTSLCIQIVLFPLSEHFSYKNTSWFQCVWISDFLGKPGLHVSNCRILSEQVQVGFSHSNFSLELSTSGEMYALCTASSGKEGGRESCRWSKRRGERRKQIEEKGKRRRRGGQGRRREGVYLIIRLLLYIPC